MRIRPQVRPSAEVAISQGRAVGPEAELRRRLAVPLGQQLQQHRPRRAGQRLRLRARRKRKGRPKGGRGEAGERRSFRAHLSLRYDRRMLNVAAFAATARAKGFGRTLVTACQSRGVPAGAARQVATALKRAAMPREALRRRRPRTNVIPRDKAWLAAALPGTEPLIAHARALFEAKRDALLAAFEPPYAFVARFLMTKAGPAMERPAEIEPIVRFCEQPAVLDIVAGYLGEVPVISNVSLIYTPPNAATVGPQQYHRDLNHPNQIHLLVAIDDVTDGPFTFIPADESARIAARIRHAGGRVDDAVFADAQPIRCEGPAGSAWFVNAYACFHHGARCRERHRFLLIVNFTSIAEGSEGAYALYRCVNRAELDNGDPVRRMLLAL